MRASYYYHDDKIMTTVEIIMDAREQAIKNWLQDHCQLTDAQLHIMPGDASFRRYFRVRVAEHSFVAMDAPPGRENCTSFIAIAKALAMLGLNTPHIIKADIANGFLLLTDFGDRLLLRELQTTNAEKLYERALDTLAILHTCKKVENLTLPSFTADFMRQELNSFTEWFLKKHLNLVLTHRDETELQRVYDFLAQTAANQLTCFMHRDYHSANLMVLPLDQIGILDFQDAFWGPVTYDLVSLLRDCYIAWPDTLIHKLVFSYREKINLTHLSQEAFLRWFDLMGIQRHLKALLTFSRKKHRDNNANYLQHIPRTVDYVIRISANYPECTTLHKLMTRVNACVE